MRLFPSPYVSIGGDEAAKDQWNASPEVRAQMRRLGLDNMDQLQAWFTQQVAIISSSMDASRSAGTTRWSPAQGFPRRKLSCLGTERTARAWRSMRFGKDTTWS